MGFIKNSPKEAAFKAARGLYSNLPVIFGVVLLIGMVSAVVPKAAYSAIFNHNPIVDSFIGSAIGSVLAGNPINSYVIGSELLEQGVGLMAVTAFIVAWVTVGVVQFPAEAILLGKRFALVRNLTAFLLSIAVAAITVAVMVVI